MMLKDPGPLKCLLQNNNIQLPTGIDFKTINDLAGAIINGVDITVSCAIALRLLLRWRSQQNLLAVLPVLCRCHASSLGD